MHISCPKCHFKRSVNSTQIPVAATMATCPKCEIKFRFRNPETGDFIDEICSNFEGKNVNKSVNATDISSNENLANEALAKNTTRLRDKAYTTTENHSEDNSDSHAENHDENKSKNGQNSGEDTLHDMNQTTQESMQEEPQERIRNNSTEDAENNTYPQAEEHVSAKNKEGQKKSQNQEDEPVDENAHSSQGLVHHEDSKPLREEDIANRYDNEDRDNPLRNPQENPYAHKKNESEKYKMVTDDVPWEHPERYGILGSLFQTISRVMFRAPDFFSTIHSQSSTLRPATFYALLGLFQTLCLQIWLSTFDNIDILTNSPGMAEQVSQFSTPMTIIMSPFFSVFQLLLFSAFLYLAIRITNPEQADYNLLLRVIAYAYAPSILSIIPYVGPLVGLIWFVVNIFIGVKYALRLTWQRTILALSPIFLLWLFIIGSSLSHSLG